jgi:leader peptidase (prepilin peptidase)/N-methyltransferase
VNATTRAVVVAVFAVLGILAGFAVPAIVRRLPPPEPANDDPADDRPAPDYRAPDYPALAGRRHLGTAGAAVGLIVFALLGWLAPPVVLPAALVVAIAALPLAYVDTRVHLLPERILWPAATTVLAVLVVQAAISSRWGSLLTAVVVAAIGFAVFFLLALLAGGGFGFGDVQLVTLLLLSAGFAGVGTAVLAVVLAIVTGGLVSLVLLLARRISRRQAVAFGPFLLLGWWMSLLVTSTIAPSP